MLLQGQGSPSTLRRQSQGSADWEIRTVRPIQQQSGGLSNRHTVMSNLRYRLQNAVEAKQGFQKQAKWQ